MTVTANSGGEYILIASKIPGNAIVTWSSSDESVATVLNGYVEGHGTEEGSAVITASITVNGITYSDTCNVTVIIPE